MNVEKRKKAWSDKYSQICTESNCYGTACFVEDLKLYKLLQDYHLNIRKANRLEVNGNMLNIYNIASNALLHWRNAITLQSLMDGTESPAAWTIVVIKDVVSKKLEHALVYLWKHKTGTWIYFEKQGYWQEAPFRVGTLKMLWKEQLVDIGYHRYCMYIKKR